MKDPQMTLFKGLSSAGFSMIELMIGGALIAMVASMGVSLFKQQNSNVKHSQSLSDLDVFHNMLRRDFLDTRHCSASLANFYRHPTGIGQINSIERCGNLVAETCMVGSSAGNKVLVEKGQKILNGNFLVKNIIVNAPPSSPYQGANLTGRGLRVLNVNIEYESLKKLDAGRKPQLRSMMTYVQFNNAGQLTKCSSEALGTSNTLHQSMCGLFDQTIASYNPETNTCELKSPTNDQCKDAGQTYVGMEYNGTPICEPFDDESNFNKLISTRPEDCRGRKKIGLAIVSSASGPKVQISCGDVSPPCQPELSCSQIKVQHCRNTSAGSDSCGTDCGQGTVNCRGGGCFVAGTQIQMSSGETKNIEDILIGDKVIDGDKKTVTAEKLISYPYQGLVYSINGGGYFFTPNHPFKTLAGWKSLDPVTSIKESKIDVSLLKIGDILVKANGLEVLYSLDSVYREELVYNFQLSGTHEYIADDYVVHNKMAVQAQY